MAGTKKEGAGLKDKLETATTQALAPRAATLMSIFNDDRIRGQLQAAARDTGLQAERLLVVALNEIRRSPQLQACTRESFVAALMGAARLGLEVGGPLGHYYLVPFRNNNSGSTEVTPILGYKGMIVLARRSGELKDLVARPVYENDKFDFAYGVEADTMKHVPADGDRGAVKKFYGVARFTNGGVFVHVMTKAEVDKFRSRSKASSSGPWVSDYDAMGCKTVIRRMAPYLPLTVEVASAIAEDEEREEGRVPEIIDLGDLEPKNGQQAPPVEGKREGSAQSAISTEVSVGRSEQPRESAEPPQAESTSGDPKKDPNAPGSILRAPEPTELPSAPGEDAPAGAVEPAMSNDPGAAFR